MSYKKDFVWGVATSSIQIEGAYKEDGKGLNVWDVFSHEPGRIRDGKTPDVACDHYHRYKEDVKLMKSLGVNAYRFSINWCRIFPEGVGEVCDAGVKFYSDLIDELLANGIEPYITLFHWEMPYELHKKGGWLNDESIEWFKQYASKVVELYSDRVTYFITFNEPQTFVELGYMFGNHAPGATSTYKDSFQIAHNVMKAHGAAVIGMRAAAKRPIKIGYAPCGNVCFPATESPEDIEAARQAYFASPGLSKYALDSISWWSDPVLLGKYPEDGLARFKDFLPEITEEDMKLIHQPLDFCAQNIYYGKEYKAGDDGRPVQVKNPDAPKTTLGWPITPKCLYWGPRFLTERYNLPFYVTENGTSGNDTVSEDGKIHDEGRINYLSSYLDQFERAANDGVDIRGYFAWSFMDNFEWSEGYGPRFGIVYTDYETMERIPKESAYWYKNYIETHTEK